MSKIISAIFVFFNKIILKKWKVNIGTCFVPHGVLFIRNWGEISIGNNFNCTSSKRYNPIGGDIVNRFVCLSGAKIVIGNNVGVSNSSFFSMSEIRIGDYVKIGGSCKFWDNDFHALNPNIRKCEKRTDINTRPIEVKNNVFIGASSIILKGVVIGENSIIGAGSVVTKSIPDNEIWAGNPAKKVGDVPYE